MKKSAAVFCATLIVITCPLFAQKGKTSDSDFCGPQPSDIKSFSCTVSDASDTCTMIEDPGEKPNFIVTDVVLQMTTTMNPMEVRLYSGAGEIAAFWISLGGRRDVHFKSGLVAKTNPGSLYLRKTGTGSGTIYAIVSAYTSNR